MKYLLGASLLIAIAFGSNVHAAKCVQIATSSDVYVCSTGQICTIDVVFQSGSYFPRINMVGSSGCATTSAKLVGTGHATQAAAETEAADIVKELN